jgi:hypothetical protein
MPSIIKQEIKRSFNNKLFLVSVLISTALVLWYSIERMPFCIEKNLTFSTERFSDDFLEISYTNWLGSHNIFLQQNIFYLIIPLLAVLPFGNSFFSDINNGVTKSIYIRTKKSHYLIAKYIAVFISGGCACVVPMVLSFTVSSALLPTMLPESSYAYTNIFASYKWADIFFTRPFLYILLYMGVVFILAGLIACISLAVSYFSFKSFLPLLFPFFVYMFISLFFELLNLEGYSIRNLLTTTGINSTTSTVIIMAVFLFIISFIPYYIIGVKKDVL